MRSEYENGFIAGIAQERETQMNLSKYNGWTNYATWRVNLEMIDGSDWPSQVDSTDVYKLSKRIQTWAEEYIEETSSEGLALDYAMAFLKDVNWYEIADHLVMDYMAEELAELGE